jgi:hypothetical protein
MTLHWILCWSGLQGILCDQRATCACWPDKANMVHLLHIAFSKQQNSMTHLVTSPISASNETPPLLHRQHLTTDPKPQDTGLSCKPRLLKEVHTRQGCSSHPAAATCLLKLCTATAGCCMLTATKHLCINCAPPTPAHETTSPLDHKQPTNHPRTISLGQPRLCTVIARYSVLPSAAAVAVSGSSSGGGRLRHALPHCCRARSRRAH